MGDNEGKDASSDANLSQENTPGEYTGETTAETNVSAPNTAALASRSNSNHNNNDGEDDDDDEDLFGGDEEDGDNNGSKALPVVKEETKAINISNNSNHSLKQEASSYSNESISAAAGHAAAPPAGSSTTAHTAAAVTPHPHPTSSDDIPIPFKSNKRAPPSVPYAQPPQTSSSFQDPALFGLPPGVQIPKSVSGTLLRQGKLLDTLKSLPVHLMNDALVEYDDAVDVKGTAIRNHGAYLYGVIKRYQSVVTRAQNTGNSDILPMGHQITPSVHTRLEQLVTTGFCTRDEMNEKVRSKIRMLSERDALFALDELSSVERHSIRNFGSYFMGILNRYMRGDQTSKIRPSGRGRDAPPPSSSSSYRENHHHQAPNRTSFPRDRSRDRFDDSSNNFGQQRQQQQQQHPYQTPQQSSYDHRRNNHNWNPQQGGPPPPPPPTNHSYPPSHGGGPLNRASQSSFMHPNSGMQQQTQMPRPQQGMNQPMLPGMGYAPQGGATSNNMNNPGMNPMVNVAGMNQMQQPFNSNMPPGHPLSQPQNMMHQQQPQQHFMQQPSLPSMQGNAMNQPQFGTMMPNNNPQMPPQPMGAGSGGPGHWQQQPPQQQQAPPQYHNSAINVDIIGLADKAASAVQALANQSNAQQMPSSMTNSAMFASINNAQGNNQQMGHSQPMNVNAPFAMHNNLHPNTPGMQMQQQQQQQPPMQMNRTSDPMRRSGRRTTASISQLTPTVQYIVQNIHSSGAIEGALDDGILGMIHDLPEQTALAALQRFVSIDKSTMRNKTAYLAGILRRELEAIRKR